MQLTAIKEGNLWTSELCCFGDSFGSVEAQCGHQRQPKQHLKWIQKQSTVNRGTKTQALGGPPGGKRGGRHVSCIRGAQLKAQNTKEISTEIP